VLAFGSDRFNLADAGESRFVQGLWVSSDYFRVLGVPALQGRVFTTDDDRRGGGPAGPVAVISYKFWKQYYPGDANVIGFLLASWGNRLLVRLLSTTGIRPKSTCRPIFTCSRSQSAWRS
jgi:hypothetical protein